MSAGFGIGSHSSFERLEEWKAIFESFREAHVPLVPGARSAKPCVDVSGCGLAFRHGVYHFLAAVCAIAGRKILFLLLFEMRR